MWLASRQPSSNKIYSLSLSDQVQHEGTDRPQDSIKPEMFDYQPDYLILLHDAFLENHPGTQAITGPALLFSDGFEVESITKIFPLIFQIARPSDGSIRSLMWKTQEKWADQTQI